MQKLKGFHHEISIHFYNGAKKEYSRVMVLDEKDWNKIHLNKVGSYGMPTALPEIDKLFLAADKKAVGKLFGETDNTSDTHLSRFDCIARLSWNESKG